MASRAGFLIALICISLQSPKSTNALLSSLFPSLLQFSVYTSVAPLSIARSTSFCIIAFQFANRWSLKFLASSSVPMKNPSAWPCIMTNSQRAQENYNREGNRSSFRRKKNKNAILQSPRSLRHTPHYFCFYQHSLPLPPFFTRLTSGHLSDPVGRHGTTAAWD